MVLNKRTRGNRHKVEHRKFHPNRKKNFFTVISLFCDRDFLI